MKDLCEFDNCSVISVRVNKKYERNTKFSMEVMKVRVQTGHLKGCLL